MKISWRLEVPHWLLIAAMWVAAILSWPSLPKRLPVHWGLDGQIDGWGGKFEALLLFPILATVGYVALLLLPRLDPGKANYPRFAGAYNTIRLCATVTFAAIYGVMHAVYRGSDLDLARAILVIVGALFLVVGNVLGKIRPNWFVGIRTPWTLSSKESWVKSHRVAGWVFIVGGLLLVAAGITGAKWLLLAAVLTILGGVVAVIVYSYLVWKRDPARVPPTGTLPAENGGSLPT